MSGTQTASAGSDDFAERSRAFIEWFRNAEGTRLSNKIELADLRHRGAGRGVVATADIAEDEELFAVPRSLVLMVPTTDYIPNTALPRPDTWLPTIIVTVQQLLKKEDSKWWPYLNALPTEFDSLMFWNEAELAELQASAVVRRIGKEKADKDFREEAWYMMYADLESFDVDGENEDEGKEHAVRMCHYAGSLIMAYAFDIDRHESDKEAETPILNGSDDGFEEDDEGNPLKGLVPFADMLNADAERNNARLFQEDNYLVMKAIKPIKAGEECFNDYGPLPRSELLRMYGYITDNYKQYDVVDLEHDLIEEAAAVSDNGAWEIRKEQLDELGVLDDGYSFPRPESDDLEEALPGDLRIVLQAIATDGKLSRSAVLSAAEVTLLQRVATKKLACYSTSLDEDKEILQMIQDGSLQLLNRVNAKRHEMALAVRIGEKEILTNIIDLCQAFLSKAGANNNNNKRKAEATTTNGSSKHSKKSKR